MWHSGRDVVMAALTTSWDPASPAYVGEFRTLATRANGRPAMAVYARGHGEDVYRPFAISVLRISAGRIAEMTAFVDAGLFAAFALPDALADR